MTFDVVVVGAGPAGALSALLLARAGANVALLDRERFPRDKPCGEFLTPGAAQLLERHGIWPASARPVPGMAVYSVHRAFAHRPCGGGPAGWMARRSDLDARLVEAADSAGARVRQGLAVRGLLRDGDSVVGVATAEGELRARLVIGADGAHSRVARHLGLVRAVPGLQRVAVVTRWRGVEPPELLEMRARAGAVCGIGPLGADSLNLTLVERTGLAARIAGRAGDFLVERTRTLWPDLAERLAGGRRESVRTIGCFGHFCRRASAPGALVAGDAAAFVDPFTGEGVYFALRGAELAADAALEALRAGDFSAPGLAGYDRARGDLARRHLLSGCVQGVVRAPALLDRALQALSRCPALADRLMGVLADLHPPGRALSARMALGLLLAR